MTTKFSGLTGMDEWQELDAPTIDADVVKATVGFWGITVIDKPGRSLCAELTYEPFKGLIP